MSKMLKIVIDFTLNDLMDKIPKTIGSLKKESKEFDDFINDWLSFPEV